MVISTIALAILSGCISQQPEVPEGNPEIDLATPAASYNATPAGLYNKSDGMFTVINGSIPEVKENLGGIINKRESQQSTFSVNDNLNFVVSRGVFSTAGYGITIDKVEKQGNAFTVYATYIDWRADAQVETRPTAIIPIGKLATGNYEARLKVTKVWDEYIEERRVMERKVTESERER